MRQFSPMKALPLALIASLALAACSSTGSQYSENYREAQPAWQSWNLGRGGHGMR